MLSCRLLPQGVLKEQPPINAMRASFWLALLGLVAAVHVAIVQSTCAGKLWSDVCSLSQSGDLSRFLVPTLPGVAKASSSQTAFFCPGRRLRQDAPLLLPDGLGAEAMPRRMLRAASLLRAR